jgi:pSer/pThr/pTyr-binding forkhead associated (FHA) protein
VGARLELSTGDLITLDRDVVIGRRPQVDRVQDGPVPTVVTVPSPQQDVSRTHLRIALSQDQVLATDLHSMNGTVLIGVDGVTRALDGGAPHTLADGDTLDLGDGITVTLRLNR